MFILSALEDELRVQPQDLHKSPQEAVTEVIEQRYIDRVLPELGLVVTLYDIQGIEGGFIYPNDGAAFFKVRFRLVVFRPFRGEVLIGRLKSCSREGVQISLGFFDDVYVPEHALQDDSFFSEVEKLWVWKWEGNDMFMDLNQPIRIKVHSVRFHSPPTPLQMQTATDEQKLLGTAAKPFVPMEVIGDINADGLGMLSWWAPADEQDEGPPEE
mmetsp:Transcript_8658/g.14927  ORF Transcript_8658/g.14927 Transcript_8658/m.14927 type:complete len:213 (-) Transcript_8658:614-1252(-)|eukprot:CAMPEP_0119101740 /NCGR_PEP_ID=MMETSP1180-20130426/709_1 /TAXON_ID=3052 ORGANISM="Chlamydomonas cf sp, Strain CCMP681" /NCGR_SAMPLE_ID=MMETSP1180 /ASSEMBLY_ACC=CAM_ASM_000741 /LENGTH=212 /DNA_ID=CAMNT_0007085907 /DNA_START=325 /DNA_END=963 /DNA_ORIENTATION=-